MSKLTSKIEQILRFLALKLKAEANTKLLNLVVNSDYIVEENTGYDNWNGGIHGHTVRFILSEETFLAIFKELDALQKEVAKGISDLMAIEDEFIQEVIFELAEETEYSVDWRQRTGALTKRLPVVVHDEDKERIWSVGGLKVFLSHKVEYKEDAFELRDQFAPIGISCLSPTKTSSQIANGRQKSRRHSIRWTPW